MWQKSIRFLLYILHITLSIAEDFAAVFPLNGANDMSFISQTAARIPIENSEICIEQHLHVALFVPKTSL